MANEVTPVEGPYETHDFTVSTSVGIPKGTICKLSDPRTAAASSANSDVFAGIAATEFVADKGKTEFGLHTKGVFLMTAGSAGFTVGALVSISGANLLKNATEAEVVTGDVVGKALETAAAGTTGEVKVGGNL